MTRFFLPRLAVTAALGVMLLSLSEQGRAASYPELIRADHPVAHWRFDDLVNAAANSTIKIGEQVSLKSPGPRTPAFPDFAAGNIAADFQGATGGPDAAVRVENPNADTKFNKGDSITIEAWVQCRGKLAKNQSVYIVGKGRTAKSSTNQNWALRLFGDGTTARVSFLFRGATDSSEADWHRWNSSLTFKPGDEWHHLAVSYTFGKPESVHGFIDGQSSEGVWDMGGASTDGPVADDAEVWMGTSMGGNPASTFPGIIDEVAIYRTALSPERIRAHFHHVGPAPKLAAVKAATPAHGKPAKDEPVLPPPQIKLSELPQGIVRVEVFEFPSKGEQQHSDAVGGNDSDLPKDEAGFEETWSKMPTLKTDEYREPAFAFSEVTNKYNQHGVKTDRSRPFLVRATGIVTLPPGEHQLHLRALTGARVAVDGEVVAETPILKAKGGDTEAVPDQAAKQLVKQMRLLPPGHKEAMVKITGDGKPHVILLEAHVGGKGIRSEIGELSVSLSTAGGSFRLLQPGTQSAVELNDTGWSAFASAQHERVLKLNAERRRNSDEEAYWKMRHDLARKNVDPAPALPSGEAKNPIDRFIDAKLAASKIAPAPVADDAAFLRRATLDTIGVIPSAEDVSAFLADKSPDKRARAIDRLLADPRWADNWVAYWQDVLAENPSMLKGTLNNTGPFRVWIYEALLDNKPMDRFVTELVAMEGSINYGGTAGFAIASQNDLPMAAKAQIVSSAFLAMEMKCARCHDAPFHNFEQADLLHFAAMLGRAPVKVPTSSLTKGLSEKSLVKVTLKAGETITATWPFKDLKSEPLPGVIRQNGDTRELLAAAITDPRNGRFPRVMVNRLWKQLTGVGIVEPVDDWETSLPSHKEMLDWLAHEFVAHDYDLKYIARLIFNSQVYQRVTIGAGPSIANREERLFQSPARRRMTAEQLVDSLFAVAGKDFDAGMLTVDPEDRQSAASHSNFGSPTRPWQFVPLSNERDRISLGKPRAQVIADVLGTFGWRESRPEPRSTRDHDANILQPALLANGTLGARVTRLSDDSAITMLALRKQPATELVTQVFLRILSRPPNPSEMQHFTQLIEPGYDTRLTNAPSAPPRARSTHALSWANHLNADAPKFALEIEKEVKTGDTPTPRLNADWRERMEDMVWAMIVSPEFVCVP